MSRLNYLKVIVDASGYTYSNYKYNLTSQRFRNKV